MTNPSHSIPETSQRSRSLRGWIAAHLVFLLLLMAAFSPVWLGGRLLAPMDILDQMYLPWRGDITVPQVHNHFVTDAITQYIPYRWFAHQSLREDGYVGWNNLNYGGTPQFANTMTTSFDWTVQLHRWLPFWTAWHLGIFLQFLIAGWGMLVFLRGEGLSPAAGLLGAICYAGNFQFIAWIYHRWALGSFCWMPLVLWALAPLLKLAWDNRAVWRKIPLRVLLAPLLLCAAFFGGTLQHSAFVVVAVGCLGLAAVLQSGFRPAAWVRCLAVFAILGALGVGLAWAMFGPCIEAFQVNQSATSRAQGFGYPGGILQPFFNLAVYPLFAFPWPLGAPNTLDLWKFFKTDLFNLPYIGFLPALLALAALFSRRIPLAPKVLMAAGFLIPLTPLVAPLYHRIFLVGILGAVWSAAAFADSLDPTEARRWSRRLIFLFAAGSLVWLVLGIGVFAFQARLGAKLAAIIERSVPAVNFQVFPSWYLARGEAFLGAVPPWAPLSFLPWLLAACGCAFLAAFARNRLRHGTFLVAVAVLAALELSLMAGRWVTFSPPASSPAALDASASDLYPATPLINTLRQAKGPLRLYTDPSVPFSIPFPPNILGTFGLPALRGYDSITDKIMEGIAVPAPDSPFLPGLAVTHAVVVKPLEDSRWQFLETKDGAMLYAFRSPSPRYEARGGDSPVVEIRDATQNRRTLSVSPGTTSVRVSENWHQGWRYRVAGAEWLRPEKNPDLSMNLNFASPAGGTLEMTFSPWQAGLSPKISLLAAAVFGVIVLTVIFDRLRRKTF